MIQKNKGVKREEVIVRNDVGEDCSVIDFKNSCGIFSTDPITGATENVGKLAVHINCNDIASSGGTPIAILVTILAPITSSLQEINKIMSEISEESAKLGLEIIGGHTEVTSAVNKIVVSVTAIGRSEKNNIVKTAGATIGDDIIVTKDIALEGTAILANDYEERCKKILSSDEFEEAKLLIDKISVLKEGIIATRIGVNSMHDITEGGLLGALFEVAAASNTGFIVYEDKIPVKESTKKIAKEFSIDPLRLISSGCMLITTDKGKELVDALRKEGIKASIVGKVTRSKGILVSNGVELVVKEPKRDELFNIK
nr:AIR synthase family protein [Clostridium cibarium]